MASTTAPFEFLPLGATIQTFKVGKTNIVQGFPKQSNYQTHNAPYFGETIGRVANRIKSGKIDSLNGKSYSLAVNDGPNHLHGGVVGWGKRIWDGPKAIGIRSIPGLEGGKLDGGESVKFTLKSDDGDEGYPGAVEASVVYTAGTQETNDGKEVRVLGIEYEAEIVDETEETVINMTNHSYFNLCNTPTIAGTDVQLCSNLYLPIENGIPTGGPVPYHGIEANKVFTLGPREPDIDDNFIANASASSIPIDTRLETLKKLVSAYHPDTAIHLEVWSTEPAFQFYTGKHINVPAVDNIPARSARSGFCVEPHRYVNAANMEDWKGQVLLKKGKVYGSRIVYRAWSDKKQSIKREL